MQKKKKKREKEKNFFELWALLITSDCFSYFPFCSELIGSISADTDRLIFPIAIFM